MEQINFPAFVKLAWWTPTEQEKDGLQVYKTSIIKFNPMALSYYFPLKAHINDEEKQLTSVLIAGVTFWIDMSFDEFDEFWDDVKRSFDIKEPLF